LKRNSIFKSISAATPDSDVVAAAAGVLKSGGLVVFPTSMLYGLGANALDSQAVARIFTIKKRFFNKPILILIKDESDLARIVKNVPESAKKMMAAFWPGRVTIVLEARSILPRILTGDTGKIGVRVPLHPVASALVHAFDGPVTGTSANLSGRAGCAAIADLDPGLVQGVDMVLDAGTLPGGSGSTVVDATTTPPNVLREGIVSKDRILSVLGID
jgi:L-threonylcarbamoyladenylate synthase